jgi:transposase
VVPDQLKSGVTVACRYEPWIQRSYEELAQHYGTVILPARPAHPRDKAKAEGGVRIAQRWILGRIRNQTFFSLSELNARACSKFRVTAEPLASVVLSSEKGTADDEREEDSP